MKLSKLKRWIQQHTTDPDIRLRFNNLRNQVVNQSYTPTTADIDFVLKGGSASQEFDEEEESESDESWTSGDEEVEAEYTLDVLQDMNREDLVDLLPKDVHPKREKKELIQQVLNSYVKRAEAELQNMSAKELESFNKQQIDAFLNRLQQSMKGSKAVLLNRLKEIKANLQSDQSEPVAQKEEPNEPEPKKEADEDNEDSVESDLAKGDLGIRDAANLGDLKAAKVKAEEEAVRVEAEKARVEAEEARIKAEKEAAKVKAEKARVEAEKEAAKVKAEEARVKAEKAKIKAEEEAARVKAEKARLKAEEEAAKVEAEEARIKAEEEAAKVKAENEAAKVKAEDARVKAEEARVKAEEARVKAEEEARVKAEKARIKAEEEAAKAKAEKEAAKVKTEKARLKAEKEAEKVKVEKLDAKKEEKKVVKPTLKVSPVPVSKAISGNTLSQVGDAELNSSSDEESVSEWDSSTVSGHIDSKPVKPVAHKPVKPKEQVKSSDAVKPVNPDKSVDDETEINTEQINADVSEFIAAHEERFDMAEAEAMLERYRKYIYYSFTPKHLPAPSQQYLDKLKRVKSQFQSKDHEFMTLLLENVKILRSIGQSSEADTLQEKTFEIHNHLTSSVLPIIDNLVQKIAAELKKSKQYELDYRKREEAEEIIQDGYTRIKSVLQRMRSLKTRVLKVVEELDATKFLSEETNEVNFDKDPKISCLKGGNLITRTVAVRKIIESEGGADQVSSWARQFQALSEQFEEVFDTVEKQSNSISKAKSHQLSLWRSQMEFLAADVSRALSRFAAFDTLSQTRVLGLFQSDPEFAERLDQVIEQAPELNSELIKLTQSSCVRKNECHAVTKAVLPNLYPYQRLASFVGSPLICEDSIRVAVVWRTGAGKTLGVIKMMDNFFNDPRPKLLIFPTESVVNNFYSELATFHNKYLEFAVTKGTYRSNPGQAYADRRGKYGLGPRPQKAGSAQNEWDFHFRKVLRKHNVMNVQDLMDFKKDRALIKTRFGSDTAYLKAPLRALTYENAYNKSVEACEKGNHARCRPIFKYRAQSDINSGNPYTGTVVVMDEAHNFLAPEQNPSFSTSQAAIVRKTSEKLFDATNSAMFFLTATPIVNDPEEGKQFMQFVKGKYSDSESNRGYVLYMNDSPRPLYPKVDPANYRNTVNVLMAPIVGPQLAKTSVIPLTRKFVPKTIQDLQAEQNVGKVHPSQLWQLERSLLRSEASQKRWNINSRVQKFAQVARYIAQQSKRTLVLCPLNAGLELFTRILEKMVGEEVGQLNPMLRKFDQNFKHRPCCNADGTFLTVTSKPQRILKTSEYNKQTLQRYNAKKLQYIVAEAEKFSEGVSFKYTDLVVIMNPPESWAKLKQQYGRAERSCASTKGTLSLIIAVSSNSAEPQDLQARLMDPENSNLSADEQQLSNIIQQRNIIETAMEEQFRSQQIGANKMKETMGLDFAPLDSSMRVNVINAYDGSIKKAIQAGLKWSPKKGKIGAYLKAFHAAYDRSFPGLVRHHLKRVCRKHPNMEVCNSVRGQSYTFERSSYRPSKKKGSNDPVRRTPAVGSQPAFRPSNPNLNRTKAKFPTQSSQRKLFFDQLNA